VDWLNVIEAIPHEVERAPVALGVVARLFATG